MFLLSHDTSSSFVFDACVRHILPISCGVAKVVPFNYLGAPLSVDVTFCQG